MRPLWQHGRPVALAVLALLFHSASLAAGHGLMRHHPPPPGLSGSAAIEVDASGAMRRVRAAGRSEAVPSPAPLAGVPLARPATQGRSLAQATAHAPAQATAHAPSIGLASQVIAAVPDLSRQSVGGMASLAAAAAGATFGAGGGQPAIAVPVANGAPPVATVASTPVAGAVTAGAALAPPGAAQVLSGAQTLSQPAANQSMAASARAAGNSTSAASAAGNSTSAASAAGNSTSGALPEGSHGFPWLKYFVFFLLLKAVGLSLFVAYRTHFGKSDGDVNKQSHAPSVLQLPPEAQPRAPASSSRRTYRKSVLAAQSADGGSDAEYAETAATAAGGAGAPAAGHLTPIPRTPSPATPTLRAQQQKLDF